MFAKVSKYTCLLILVSQPIAIADSTAGKSLQLATVCEISSVPSSFYGKRVNVRVRIVSNGIDRSGLEDPKGSCKSIAWRISESAKNNPKVKAIDDAIYCIGYIGTPGKILLATVTGVIRAGPERSLLMIDSATELHFHFDNQKRRCDVR